MNRDAKQRARSLFASILPALLRRPRLLLSSPLSDSPLLLTLSLDSPFLISFSILLPLFCSPLLFPSPLSTGLLLFPYFSLLFLSFFTAQSAFSTRTRHHPSPACSPSRASPCENLAVLHPTHTLLGATRSPHRLPLLLCLVPSFSSVVVSRRLPLPFATKNHSRL